MMIKKVRINNNKKCLEIETSKDTFALPFSKLDLIPNAENTIKKAYVDEELGNRAVTYILDSGEEDTVHLDAFLDYNKDPEYMKKMTLYKLTLQARELVKQSKLPKREIARKLRTSPPQLYRLLDTTNYSKTIDQMIKLLASLGYEIGFTLQDPTPTQTSTLKLKFCYLKDEELRTTPRKSTFKPLMFAQRQAA